MCELCLVIIQLQHILIHPLLNFRATQFNMCYTILPIIVGMIHIQLGVVCIGMVRQSMPLNDITNRFDVHAINFSDPTQNPMELQSPAPDLLIQSLQ